MMKSEIELVIDTVAQIAQGADQIERTTPLLDSGYINSLDVFHVIAELERVFSIKIGAMDATMGDFTTPNSILELVQRVRAG